MTRLSPLTLTNSLRVVARLFLFSTVWYFHDFKGNNVETSLSGQPEAQALLYSKMSKVLAAVGPVAKNGTNSHFGYKFVREGDLIDAIRKHLADHNLCLFVGASELVETRDTEGKAGPVTTIRMTATFCCGDGGAKFSVSWMGSGQDAGDKGLYKAMTGGLKYLLMKTFLVSTGDDPEQEERQPQAQTGPRRHEEPAGDHGDFVMPFGTHKGKKLRDIPMADLMSSAQWAQDKNKFREFQAAATEWLADLATPGLVPLKKAGAA